MDLQAPVEGLRARERALLSVARALLQRPVMLLLQDLALSVDAHSLNELDKMLVSQKQVSVLHLSSVATRLEYFERVAVFHNGGVIESGPPKLLISQPGILSEMVLETGPVASNLTRKALGVPLRPLQAVFEAPVKSASKLSDNPNLASSVGVLGPISEMLEDEGENWEGSASKGSPLPAEAEEVGRSVYAPLATSIAQMLSQKDVGYLFLLIQSCVASLHDVLNLDVRTGLAAQVVAWPQSLFVTYHVCSRMLTYAGSKLRQRICSLCSRMLAYACGAGGFMAAVGVRGSAVAKDKQGNRAAPEALLPRYGRGCGWHDDKPPRHGRRMYNKHLSPAALLVLKYPTFGTKISQI